MKSIKSIKFALLFAPILFVSACGGGSDIEDRLDIADPKVRFVDAAPNAPLLTLYRNDNAQSDATSVGYKFASGYFDVETGSATWHLRNGSTELSSVGIDTKRGNRYNLIAVGSGTSGAELISIRDPYNKGLITNRARVRAFNAAPNSQALDIYVTADLSLNLVSPTLNSVGYKQAVPGDGNDSQELEGARYRLRMTLAGTRTVVFDSFITLDNNVDWMLVVLPDRAAVSNSVKVLAVRVGSDNKSQPTIELTTN